VLPVGAESRDNARAVFSTKGRLMLSGGDVFDYIGCLQKDYGQSEAGNKEVGRRGRQPGPIYKII
jgi:hypothetical protein